MSSSPPPVNPNPAHRPRSRNARTQAQQRRDIIWQMAVPLGVVFVALATLGVLVCLPLGAGVRSAWADVSLIFLIIPTLLFGLIVAVLVIGLCAGMVYLLRETPYFFKLVQDFMALFSYRVQAGAEKVSGVFLSAQAAAAGAQRAAKDLRRVVQRGG
jgi:ABC-type Fe3+ transport system permease subunit